ncbi:Reticulocyte-binding protein 2 -like protein a [Halotydeus destructor]|nr:Reticulocyte-binding protein 2 -like protein a [Halotydeus destructor]
MDFSGIHYDDDVPRARFRRKRHPELVPYQTPEREFLGSTTRLSVSTPRKPLNGSQFSTPKASLGPKRTVSLTRLDQLAQPKQRHIQETLKARASGKESTTVPGDCMVKSMIELPSKTPPPSMLKSRLSKGMSSSMTHLNSNRKSRQQSSANTAQASCDEVSMIDLEVSELESSNGQWPSKSSRDNRSSRLRSMSSSVRSPFNEGIPQSKDGVLSPNRPTSSLSIASEKSSTPVVAMRTKTVSRKPRPMSMGAFSSERKATGGAEKSETEKSSSASKVLMRPQVARKPRPISMGVIPDKRSDNAKTPSQSSHDKNNGEPLAARRPGRARSAGANNLRPVSLHLNEDIDGRSGGAASPEKPTLPRKPAHVKAAAAARKAVKVQHTTVEPNQDDKAESESGQVQNVAIVSKDELDKEPTESADPVSDKVESKENEVDDARVPIENPVTSLTNNYTTDGDVKPSTDESNVAAPKKDISEDEYKRVMAEKRRIAREQAEREAELERQRQEQLMKEEEERIFREEEEMRMFEEEQIRLAQEHRQAEEEKLRQAIEEQQKREEEARRAREEEARQRLEREEQELRAKEKAEKARIELEERLRRDEEERLARKKRLEAIMSRTRKAPGKSGSPTNSEDSQTPEPTVTDSSNTSPEKNNGSDVSVKNLQNKMLINSLGGDSEETLVITTLDPESSKTIPHMQQPDLINQLLDEPDHL